MSTETLVIEPLSTRLRHATAAAHEQAEQSSFIEDLLGGRLNRDAFRALARQHLAIYTALEDALARHQEAPVLAPLLDSRLDRTVSLAADVAALEALELPVLDATRNYIADITASSAAELVGHHYTRYLGDLSGGQIVARLVARNYALVEGEPGLLFYHFSQIAKPKVYKDDYRGALDAAPWDEFTAAAAIGGATRAFEHNSAMFAELATAH